ncbi:hypothetical protein M422DRAFT_265495 [Sphaerobolus stellatus SS14]|uniref:Azaphilone pigments biosynthesis cluster protein L N-terminal domain-containing protein n=1 Tax=Sphaerobolus stellatus (strain SS14) TaxID=990650 RepID=A0A0C9TQZ0_SPHS4|nr:hypothetical protein M422DRAFT_265495 [Sphaerobolus stellatus SS14]
MDPLSVSSAIVGFLGFATQVGDIIAKISSADKDEKKSIEELKGQIDYFTRILSELKALIDESAHAPGNSSQDYSQLATCLETCKAQLQASVDKFQPPVNKRRGLLSRVKWLLKDEERNKLIELVDRCKSNIQLELTVRQGQAMQSTARTAQIESYKDKIMKWLDIVEVNSNLDRARQK